MCCLNDILMTLLSLNNADLTGEYYEQLYATNYPLNTVYKTLCIMGNKPYKITLRSDATKLY